VKTVLPKLLMCRLAQAGGLLAIIAALAASIAWSDNPDGRVKLGGAWVGKNGDITWTSTWSPDSSGRNATITLQWITSSADFEALFGLLGADHSSIVCGSVSMVSPHTAKGNIVWYIYAEGTPSATQPATGQIKAVAVMTDESHFTSPTTAVGKHVLKLYSPDPQNPMVPNEAYRFFEQTFDNVSHTKIF